MSILVYPEYQLADQFTEQFAEHSTTIFTDSQHNTNVYSVATNTSTAEIATQTNSKLLQLLNSHREDTKQIVIETYSQIGRIFNCVIEITGASAILIIGFVLLPIFFAIQLVLVLIYIPFFIQGLVQKKNIK